MPTIRQILERLLPFGSNPSVRDKASGSPPNWDFYPNWPPDLFAVAATLVNLSGCYTHGRYTGWVAADMLFAGEFHDGTDAARGMGAIVADWVGTFAGHTTDAPAELGLWWADLVRAGGESVYSEALAAPAAWHDAAFRLMIAADEACVGVGFVLSGGGSAPIAETVLLEYARVTDPHGADASPAVPAVGLQLPHSLCRAVPKDEAVVQPKAMTPQVGCTLRSFSHHLALLPSVGEVKTSWRLGRVPPGPPDGDPDAGLLNLLVVPFPFAIREDCFVPAEPCVGNECFDGRHDDGNRHSFFELVPRWLDPLGRDTAERAKAFAGYLEDLIRAAEADSGGPVHGVVLPEAALTFELAEQVAKLLAVVRGLELFITGFSQVRPDGDGEAEHLNGIFTVLFEHGQLVGPFLQHKHHRWKLDRSQVRNYRLDTRLNPSHGVFWWEKMSIKPRECGFVVFRPGACLAALDCEDLGRIEPVQQAIRAIGANFVICLLLDGAQIVGRWPHRYAMVLADDPGSSVLTLTSLGMMLRYPKQTAPYAIGLWKERNGDTKELTLEAGSHGLLLTLWPDDERNFSMDGRSDFRTTVAVTLSGYRQVRFPATEHKKPPVWAGLAGK